MGFFGELFDDLLELPGKVIETPFKLVNRVLCLGDHDWGLWERVGRKRIRTCHECGTKEEV